MALENRQDGEVKIFVGIQKVKVNSKNTIRLNELTLKVV